MRILFAFAGGSGHFEPLMPIARAASAAGHTVAFACQRALLPAVEAAGFTGLATAGATFGDTPQRRPLLKLDAEREDRDLRDGFADRLARTRADALLRLCAEWLPDLIVCDEVDFGSLIAAEQLGIPYASVQVIAAGSFVRRELVAEPLSRLRAEHGLPPDPSMEMLSRYLVLSPIPTSFRDPAFPPPATLHAFRAMTVEPAHDHGAPDWLAQRSAAPLVYFTLGTVFNLESGDLFTRVLDGLRQLPIRVIATVGRDIDPQEFGPQPAHIQIERYVPQRMVLPYCSLAISHGGSGSVIGTLAHGLPAVLIPMGADQPHNAARCADLGLARVLDAVEATPADVRDAVAAVLEDHSYRQAAERMRDEIAALPEISSAVSLLERLAAERQPIYAI